GHHPSSPAEGALGLRGRLRTTTAAKQLSDRGHPQLLAALTDRSIARNGDAGIGPQEAGSAGQATQNSCHRQAWKEGQSDNQVDDGHHVEGALALLPSMAVSEHLLDSFQWKEVLQSLQTHVMKVLIILGKVTYAKGQQ